MTAYLQSHLQSDETFIDFSNSPITYYFTQKETPAYFYQTPLNITNDYLQNAFLQKISQYKTPLVLFSRSSESWFDAVDGVPNPLRLYRVAEMLYQQYEPFITVDDLCIWKKKVSSLTQPQKTIFHTSQVAFSSDGIFSTPLLRRTPRKQYLLSLYAEKPFTCSVQEIPENATSGKDVKLWVNDTDQNRAWYIIEPSEEYFRIQVKSATPVTTMLISESDYLPDMWSFRSVQYDLKLLPLIWGTYDPGFKAAPVQATLFSGARDMSTGSFEINLPSDVDKSTGNFVSITISGTNTNYETLELSYGNDSEIHGKFSMLVPPGEGKRTLAVRISSQYMWYRNFSNIFRLKTKLDTSQLIVHEFSILKGN